jgi:uncharacterized membrane protein
MRFVRSDQSVLLGALAAGALLLCAGGARGQVTFTAIPQLAGGSGGNVGAFIAGYGQFVVGDSDSSNTQGTDVAEGYRFDRYNDPSFGLLGVGAFSTMPFESHAAGICADGAFVVGTSVVPVMVGAQSGNQARAFFWSQFGGVYNIGIAGAPAGDLGSSYAYALSGDGGTTVGATTTATSSTLQAFRWQGVISVLPALAGPGPSIARAVSFNGAVIVGESAGMPFRWTNTGGAGTTDQIPALPGAPDGQGAALGMNSTGSVVVGRITSPLFVDSSTGTPKPQGTAFRWTASGIQDLGALPSSGTQFSESVGVSNSGLVVVGNSRVSGSMAGGETNEPFVWTPRWGMTSLSSMLAQVLPSGVTLTSASGISYDGTVIAGTGRDIHSGTSFAYVATIPVYCPSDQNGNGVVEVQDIFDFLNDWFAGLSRADANGNGVLEVQDIFDYLNAWFQGC